jgi:hypothetical protein
MTAFPREAAVIPLDLWAKQSGTVRVATQFELRAAFSTRASGLCSVAGLFPTCLNKMEKTA